MATKANYQNQFVEGNNRNFRNVVQVYDLAGEVYKAVYGEMVAVTGNVTLTAEDTGKTFLVSADATVTLPATVAGVHYTFINVAARTTAEIVLSPVTADGIYGTTNASTNVVFSGTDDVDIKNTKASAEKGDNITILGDGSNGWYVVGCHGIWANV